jgi:hypothetical protein
MSIPGIGGRARWCPTQADWQRVAQQRQEGWSVARIAEELGTNAATLRRECWKELGLAPLPYGSGSHPLSLAERPEGGDVDAAATLVERYARQGDTSAATALFRAIAPPPRMRWFLPPGNKLLRD